MTRRSLIRPPGTPSLRMDGDAGPRSQAATVWNMPDIPEWVLADAVAVA